MTLPFEFRASGRNRKTALALAAVWAALLGAYIFLNAAWWLMLAIFVFTLPALWDLWSDRPSSLTLDARRVGWTSGTHSHEVLLANIASVHFNTRFDFSVKVILYMKTGPKIRLPWDVLPPHEALEAAFQEAGVKTERHHFTIMT